MSYTLPDILEKAIKYFVNQIHVCVPARIVEYESDKQKASVKPLIKQKLINDKVLELPIINDVPVVFPRTQTAGMTFPINKDDLGLAIFSDRALENWLTAGGTAEPGSTRKYDISDAIFIPGLYPFTDDSPALDDALQLFSKNAIIKLDNDSKIAIGDKREGIELLEQLANLAQTLSTESQLDPPNKIIYGEIADAINSIKGTL